MFIMLWLLLDRQLTHWLLKDVEVILRIFQTWYMNWYREHFLSKQSLVSATGPYWWAVSIGSGNGLVPSGNKPLPDPMLTQTYFATRPQCVTNTEKTSLTSFVWTRKHIYADVVFAISFIFFKFHMTKHEVIHIAKTRQLKIWIIDA